MISDPFTDFSGKEIVNYYLKRFKNNKLWFRLRETFVFMKNGRVLNYLLHETVRLTDPIEKEKYVLVFMYTAADNQ